MSAALELFEQCIEAAEDGLGRSLRVVDWRTEIFMEFTYLANSGVSFTDRPLEGVFAVASIGLGRDCLLINKQDLLAALAGAAALCALLDARVHYEVAESLFSVFIPVLAPEDTVDAGLAINRAMNYIGKALPRDLVEPADRIYGKLGLKLLACLTAVVVLLSLASLLPWPINGPLCALAGVYLSLLGAALRDLRASLKQCAMCRARKKTEQAEDASEDMADVVQRSLGRSEDLRAGRLEDPDAEEGPAA